MKIISLTNLQMGLFIQTRKIRLCRVWEKASPISSVTLYILINNIEILITVVCCNSTVSWMFDVRSHNLPFGSMLQPHGFHTLIRNVLFLSPINVWSHNLPPWDLASSRAHHPMSSSNVVCTSLSPPWADTRGSQVESLTFLHLPLWIFKVLGVLDMRQLSPSWLWPCGLLQHLASPKKSPMGRYLSLRIQNA